MLDVETPRTANYTIMQRKGDTAMLLPLRRPVRNPAAFYAFEKIRYSTPDEKRHRDQRSVSERDDVI
jgi:hypothetical protein